MWRRQEEVGQTIRNDNQLQQFVLTDVIPTGKILGTGSYGSVVEVSYQHLVCAGKKLHDTLMDVENDGLADVVRRYLRECQLMSSLHHPNITQFLGLCFLPGTQLPLLVMERLETSLDDLLEHMPNLPLALKCSVLEDVSRGLLYLHSKHPSVIHRDLTSKNVLLTSSLVAKITDMGNSRIVNMRPGQMAKTLTKYPGTLVYMPPEAQGDADCYGTSMDIFSFGHLALYTVTQKFPGDLLPSTYLNPDNDQDIRGRSEVERRGVYIAVLESQISDNHPALVELVKQCLHNNPRQRPSTEELLTSLQGLRGQVEGEYGGGAVKVDLSRIRLAKEVKEKDKKIDELTQEQARQTALLEEVRRTAEESTRQFEVQLEAMRRSTEESTSRFEAQLEEMRSAKTTTIQLQAELEETRKAADNNTKQLEAELEQARKISDDKTGELQRMAEDTSRRLEAKERHIVELVSNLQAINEDVVAKDEQITRKGREFASIKEQLQALQTREAELRRKFGQLQTKEAEPRKELQIYNAVRNEQRTELLCQAAKPTRQAKFLQLPLNISWRQGTNMPFEMAPVSVMMDGKLYIGGGGGTVAYLHTVMVYSVASGSWSILPPYKFRFFAMAGVDNRLVLIGGTGDGRESKSKVLGVWDGTKKAWTHPYPVMKRERVSSSAVVHNKWLVVAGGWERALTKVTPLSSVEVLHTENKVWYDGPSSPMPWCAMKTVMVGNEAYFVGGYDASETSTTDVYCVDIPTLITQTTSKSFLKEKIWKVISGLSLTESTPLSIGGRLLVIGGKDKHKRTVSDIHIYQPASGDWWVKAGDLPSPRCKCTCAMIGDTEFIVAGGQHLESVDIAQLN